MTLGTWILGIWLGNMGYTGIQFYLDFDIKAQRGGRRKVTLGKKKMKDI